MVPECARLLGVGEADGNTKMSTSLRNTWLDLRASRHIWRQKTFLQYAINLNFGVLLWQKFGIGRALHFGWRGLRQFQHFQEKEAALKYCTSKKGVGVNCILD